MNTKANYYDESVKMLSSPLSDILLKIPESKKTLIQEIRLRCDKPIALTCGNDTFFVCNDGNIIFSPAPRAVISTKHNIFDTFRSLCGYSVYSRQSEITKGFITAQNGSRIGICGTAAVKNGEISAVTDITSMNIRISRQITGTSDELISRLFPLSGGILIAGKPSSGKTTILRDLAYNISTGKNTKIMRTCIVDERGEISGGNNGFIDTGLSDVQVCYPKIEGILQSIRSLSPQVIICDEVGSDEDAKAVAMGSNAGIYMIATIHAGNYNELVKREQAIKLIKTGAFSKVVILGDIDTPGTISEIVDISDLKAG